MFLQFFRSLFEIRPELRESSVDRIEKADDICRVAREDLNLVDIDPGSLNRIEDLGKKGVEIAPHRPAFLVKRNRDHLPTEFESLLGFLFFRVERHIILKPELSKNCPGGR